MLVQERFYTAEEFWELLGQPEYAGKRVELVEGEIREMAPAGGEHGEVAIGIGSLIWSHVQQNRLGRVTAAETGYVLYKNSDPGGRDTVRAPDVGFVSLERAPQPFSEKFVPLAPDLAVEVISPNDGAEAVEEKVLDYLRYGVRQVWLIYPSSKTIVVQTSAEIRRLAAGDTLDGGDVLPGFSVRVGEIFPTG
ncbi:MAG: Uma2 family endonuclease [Chloroflexi bacterium]|nr:Uma2 family endonuclease [Chloroflexota bacterium]MDL1883815.1 Uma2 family endonuclease [Anaerolineae bacterium CFX8]